MTESPTNPRFYRWPHDCVRFSIPYSKSGWPLKELRDKVMSAGCHLVPKFPSKYGSKAKVEINQAFDKPPTSNRHNQQSLPWRVSFSVSEKILAKSFNFAQRRCFLLTKVLLSYQSQQVKKKLMEAFPEPKTIPDLITRRNLIKQDLQKGSHGFMGKEKFLEGKLIGNPKAESLYDSLTEFWADKIVSDFEEKDQWETREEEFIYWRMKLLRSWEEENVSEEEIFSVSSFVLKHVFFWTMEEVDPREWRVNNLYSCISRVLMKFEEFLGDSFVPHYFFGHKKNLMAGDVYMRPDDYRKMQEKCAKMKKEVLSLRTNLLNVLARSGQ